MFRIGGEKLVDQIFKESLVIFIDQLKTWEGFEEYIPKMESFLKNFMDRCVEIYKPNSHYNVLNHGDHHPKNMMFKIEEGKFNDVCFVSRFSMKIFTLY